MKPPPRYDICEARAQVEQGKTIYRKLVEVMERVEIEQQWPGFEMRPSGKFEMREISREEFYA